MVCFISKSSHNLVKRSAAVLSVKTLVSEFFMYRLASYATAEVFSLSFLFLENTQP